MNLLDKVYTQIKTRFINKTPLGVKNHCNCFCCGGVVEKSRGTDTICNNCVQKRVDTRFIEFFKNY